MNKINRGPRVFRRNVTARLLVLLSIVYAQEGTIAAETTKYNQTNLGILGVKDGPPLDSTCVSPITPIDTSTPTSVVGKGDPSTCTEEALEDAVSRGGIITFDCGGPATIAITSEKNLRTDVDTVIDGNGQITLDAKGGTRFFNFYSIFFRTNTTTVTFQNIAFVNGAAWGTPIPVEPYDPPYCATGYAVDGGGAAIWIRDGILHLINCSFENNQGAPVGPDVAGGAIYALGSLEVIVVASQFLNNAASNGGAIGMLNSDLMVINSTFIDSAATGHDANNWAPECSQGESGSGGSGGAIFVDGGGDLADVFCGSTFIRSQSGQGATGGAIFRAPDEYQQTTTIDQCTFEQNSSPWGGGALYFTNSNLVITKSTFFDNAAVIGGALQSDTTSLTVENSTFSNNRTSLAWGAMALFGCEGDIRNCTFVGNQAGFSPVLPDFGEVSIENSIFFNNVATLGEIACDNTSSGYGNVQWPDPGKQGPNSLSGCVWGVGVADTALGELTNNGGPTNTYLPDPSTAAFGLGSICPATDQRNEPRTDPYSCTAGSVEIN